jgi:hypothetical protein
MDRRTSKLLIIYSAIFFSLIILAGCAKEGDDLTASVVGHYLRGVGTNALLVNVTKVNNKTVAITFETTNSASTHGNSTMNSTTELTLSSSTGLDLTKNERYEYAGTGTLNGENLTLTRHEKVFSNSTGTLITEYDTTYVVKRR